MLRVCHRLLWSQDGVHEQPSGCTHEDAKVDILHCSGILDGLSVSPVFSRFKEAEVAAGTALRRDPTSFKARLRRGICRFSMGDYEGALPGTPCVFSLRKGAPLTAEHCPDMLDVLNINPTCQEALDARRTIDAAGVKPKPRRPDSFQTEFLRDVPRPDDPPTPDVTPFNSDSEDFNHDGRNEFPCRAYNHDGCFPADGKKCNYRHSPDSKSVRDDMLVFMDCRRLRVLTPFARPSQYVVDRTCASHISSTGAGRERKTARTRMTRRTSRSACCSTLMRSMTYRPHFKYLTRSTCRKPSRVWLR